LLLVCAAFACSDPPPPVEVVSGRLTVKVFPEPAQLAIFLDGNEVWTTRTGRGSGKPPDGFAAAGGNGISGGRGRERAARLAPAALRRVVRYLLR